MDRSASSRAIARLAGGVQVDLGGAGDGALRRPARVEQAELDLLGEQPPGGPVDELLGHLAAPHPLHEPGAEAERVRQLDVDARRAAPARRPRRMSAATRCMVARNGTAQ